MPLPNLIHPIDIVIKPIDRASTTYDRQAREPVRTVKRAAADVLIEAQVSYRGTMNPRLIPEGIAEQVAGYLLFRVFDLTEAGYAPNIGDRITAIGLRTTSLFVLQNVDLGHYGDQNGASLVRVFFEDRRPSADAPTMVS